MKGSQSWNEKVELSANPSSLASPLQIQIKQKDTNNKIQA